jgi:tight adherence protein B
VRAALRTWWSIAGLLAVLGVTAVMPGVASAQREDGSVALSVDRVDATGDRVLVDGGLTGADPSGLSLSVDGTAVDPADVRSIGGGLRNDVVVVVDNAASLGNATVQLAKDALEPLMPGAGAVESLGVITTGGRVEVPVGPTTSAAVANAGVEGISPGGESLLWDGIARAGRLLEDRGANSVGTVVVFTASPIAKGAAAPSVAESALQQAGARLEVVSMQSSSSVGSLADMVADLGGQITRIDNDEELAGAFAAIGGSLAGRFRVSFPSTDQAGELVPASLGIAGSTVDFAYTSGAVRTGSVGLAPVGGDAGGGLAAPVVKWFAVLLGVGAVVVLVWTVLSMVLPSETDLVGRLEMYDESFQAAAAQGPDEDQPVGQATVPIIQRAVEFTGEMAERRGQLDKLELRLERANLPLRAAEAIFFTAASAGVLALLALVLSQNMLLALIVAGMAVIVPMALLNMRVRRRQKAFVGQLPDMLSLLAGTLKAGYSIGQGFESVSKEIDDPMGRELRRVVTETRLGRSLEESLEAVAERMDSEDFGWTVMAIKIQREVGGNLAELLMTVAETMTQRERLRRDVSTLTAEGRMSAIIIGILPPGLAAILTVMNPEYISVLFQPGLGYILVAASLVMMGIGFAWMKKCITIEV